MIKLFGFVRSRAGQPARLVRVEATGTMSRDELRRKLVEISARKQRVCKTAMETVPCPPDDHPPSSFQTLDARHQFA